MIAPSGLKKPGLTRRPRFFEPSEIKVRSAIMSTALSKNGSYRGDTLMQLRASRAIFSLVVILVVSAGLGGLFGRQVQATPKGEAEVDSSARLLTQVLGLLED